eukprot:6267605-Pyramimonas_sp.AAC.1
MPGLLPLFLGMEVTLTESVLPPQHVRGTPGKVVGIEQRALEHPVEGRASVVSDGVAALRYMPKAVYVKIDDADGLFLKAAPVTAGSASQPAGPDLRGVLSIAPQARPWKFKATADGPAIT